MSKHQLGFSLHSRRWSNIECELEGRIRGKRRVSSLTCAPPNRALYYSSAYMYMY